MLVSWPLTVRSILFDVRVWKRMLPIDSAVSVLMTVKSGLVERNDGIRAASLAILKSAIPVTEFHTSSLPIRTAGIG